MPTDPVIRLSQNGGVAAVYRNVALNYWRTTSTAPVADAARRAMLDLARTHPGSAVYLNVTNMSDPPANDVRDVWMRMMREGEGKVQSAAIVTIAGGFSGSIARGVTTGLLLAVRPRMPIKVFQTLDEGARFLVSTYALGSQGASADEIVAAVEAVQRMTAS